MLVFDDALNRTVPQGLQQVMNDQPGVREFHRDNEPRVTSDWATMSGVGSCPPGAIQKQREFIPTSPFQEGMRAYEAYTDLTEEKQVGKYNSKPVVKLKPVPQYPEGALGWGKQRVMQRNPKNTHSPTKIARVRDQEEEKRMVRQVHTLRQTGFQRPAITRGVYDWWQRRKQKQGYRF